MKHWVSESLAVFSIPGFLSGLPEVLWVVLWQATETHSNSVSQMEMEVISDTHSKQRINKELIIC